MSDFVSRMSGGPNLTKMHFQHANCRIARFGRPHGSMTIHPSLTAERLTRAIKRSMRDDTFPGFCVACGRRAKRPAEPDAREYPCSYKRCGGQTVYGAEELLFMVQG